MGWLDFVEFNGLSALLTFFNVKGTKCNNSSKKSPKVLLIMIVKGQNMTGKPIGFHPR